MNANCAKYWFLVYRFVPNTGACFAAFVPKYWSSACRPFAKLPVLVFSLYAYVSCRCIVAIASEMSSCDWMCCAVYQCIDGCMNYDVLQHFC
jgi:hypothetical protein